MEWEAVRANCWQGETAAAAYHSMGLVAVVSFWIQPFEIIGNGMERAGVQCYPDFFSITNRVIIIARIQRTMYAGQSTKPSPSPAPLKADLHPMLRFAFGTLLWFPKRFAMQQEKTLQQIFHQPKYALGSCPILKI